MKSRYLKIRMSYENYLNLKNRAAEDGKPISTYSHNILIVENSMVHTATQLVEIQSQLQQLAALLASANSLSGSSQLNVTLCEVLLIVRELALERNPQILSRVSSQIKHQSQGK